MSWDDDKSTASDPDNPTADERITADEWDTHVADQKGHSSRHEKNGSDELTTFGDTTHDSVTTDQLSTEARGPSVVVHTDGTTIWADGPDSELASGDFGTQADVTTVIQAAIDEGGHVTIKKHSSNYQLGVAGQDQAGEDYCLEMKADTHLEIERGATLEYPASDTDPIDVATPILCSGISGFHIELHGTVDAGYHNTSQPDSHDNSVHAIKVGESWNNDDTISGTACSNFLIDGGGTITGGTRHGIEVGSPKGEPAGPGLIENITSDDGAGDDDFAIGGPGERITYRSCQVENRLRSGVWGPSGFEMDDGPKKCYFIDCHIDHDGTPDDITGFILGKMHGWGTDPNEDNYAIGCSAEGCDVGFGVFVNAGSTGTVKNIVFRDCTANGSDFASVQLQAHGSVSSIKIEGGELNGADKAIAAFVQGTLDGLVIDTTTRECVQGTSGAILLTANNGTLSNVKLGGEHYDHTGDSVKTEFSNGGVLDKLVARGGLFRGGSKAAFNIDGSNTNFSGKCIIENNHMQDNGFGPPAQITFQNANIREHVITRNNIGFDDASAVEPTSPDQGEWYIDDGTNTESGDVAMRMYDGSSWQDVGPAIVGTNDTDDSMTADPETATESGYIEVQVGGSTKQVPFYDP